MNERIRRWVEGRELRYRVAVNEADGAVADVAPEVHGVLPKRTNFVCHLNAINGRAATWKNTPPKRIDGKCPNSRRVFLKVCAPQATSAAPTYQQAGRICALLLLIR